MKILNTKIRDYKSELLLQLKKTMELYESADVEISVDESFNKIDTLLQRVEPSLMFYGVYNAGKSTLLNAIFGEMKASVADVPETHQVSYYKWGNFHLVDTPGVNGPIEDFYISQAELKKHDIIMFVIDDSDTFDSSFVAEQLVEIMAQNKPLIIVLNNKQSSDNERLEKIRVKLYRNILKAAQVKQLTGDISERYEFIVVNANMAYKGKVENKTKLLQFSKIQNLEILITEQLKKISGVKLLLTPLELLVDVVKEISNVLNNNMFGSEKKQFKELLEDIEGQKNLSLNELQTFIKWERNRYQELLYNQIISGNDIEATQLDLSNRVNGYIKDKVNTFAHVCHTEFDSFIKTAKIRVAVNFESPSSSGIESSINKAMSTSNDNNEGTIEKLLSIVPIVETLPMPPIIKIGLLITGIAKLFKKDDMSKNLERIQAEIEANNILQREAMNRRINAMQEVRTQLNIQLHKFEEEALTIAKESILKIYEQVTEEIGKMLVDADERFEAMSRIGKEISEIETMLLSIKNEIS